MIPSKLSRATGQGAKRVYDGQLSVVRHIGSGAVRYLNSASAAVAELIAGYDSDHAVEAGGVPPALDATWPLPRSLSKQCIWSEIQEQACHVYFDPLL